MFKRTLLCATVFGMAALAPPAMAQQAPCGPRTILTERLNEKFGEVITGGGLRSQDQMIEIWSAPTTGSWTVLATSSDGMSCILAAGTDWYQMKALEIPDDIPS